MPERTQPSSSARGLRRARPPVIAAIVAIMVAVSPMGIAPATSSEAVDWPAPVDPQDWVDVKDLTWADFAPVPGQPAGWRDGSIRGSDEDYTGAAVLLDFIDQPFLITQEAEAHPFGNPRPGLEPVAQGEVGEWMEDYLNSPNQYNGGQSITGYWMEDTHGKISVDITAFGPYALPGKLHEYGLAGYAPTSGAESRCPAGDACNKNIRTDGLAAWQAAEGATINTEFDFIFYVTAGHDETSTWQEFGEMLFQTREDVPAALGPPGAEDGPVLNDAGQPILNWSPTRYVPWTSWRSAANHWPNAGGGSSTQAENSGQGVYAHEFSHIRGLPDNYNNPFADNQRAGTGYWEMMSRGSFNGPGGTHNRWQVPNAGGSGLGPHHTLHFKQQLGILDPEDQVALTQSGLTAQGIAVVTLRARESVPDGDPVGLEVTLDGGYVAGKCEGESPDPGFWCPPGSWQSYTMEVVDRMGNDSFTPGHGVLLAQARSSGSPSVWLIDANPQDVNMIDFYRPDGTPAPVVRGDPRQLNDATFHAGTGSGSEFEYVEEFNRLHFYILDTHRDADGVLFYDVAVRNLDGAGAFRRGVDLDAPAVATVDPSTTLLEVPLTNTGEAGAGVFDSDVYRVSASVDGQGWDVRLPYEVRAAAAGETVTVPVYAIAGSDAAGPATVTIAAVSEADPAARQAIAYSSSGLLLGYDGPLQAVRGGTATLTATLAADGAPLAGRTLTFRLGGSETQATTDGSGTASVEVPVDQSYGRHPLEISYAEGVSSVVLRQDFDVVFERAFVDGEATVFLNTVTRELRFAAPGDVSAVKSVPDMRVDTLATGQRLVTVSYRDGELTLAGEFELETGAFAAVVDTAQSQYVMAGPPGGSPEETVRTAVIEPPAPASDRWVYMGA